ncbi:MAG TPA: acyl-homoserine-lactone synthase [Rickettsiales bacterium]|nr:acyl-homoserine-lactone synthase [Rickettsiales bacterium]
MGVHIVSIENAHKYGDIIPQMLRLRYKEFKERQSYDIPIFKDMEYDTYDTPATVYVIWRGEDGVVRGCSRMAPTDRAYMIKNLWPDMVTTMELPEGNDIWESSRFCVDRNLPAAMRKLVKLEILQAKIEYALAVGIKGMVGVMPPLIWRAVFVNSGWPIEHIGPVTELASGEKVVAAWIHVNSEILVNLRKKTDIHHSLLLSNEGLEHILVREARKSKGVVERDRIKELA